MHDKVEMLIPGCRWVMHTPNKICAWFWFKWAIYFCLRWKNMMGLQVFLKYRDPIREITPELPLFCTIIQLINCMAFCFRLVLKFQIVCMICSFCVHYEKSSFSFPTSLLVLTFAQSSLYRMPILEDLILIQWHGKTKNVKENQDFLHRYN